MKDNTLKKVSIDLHLQSSWSPCKDLLPTFPLECNHTSSIVKVLYEYA